MPNLCKDCGVEIGLGVRCTLCREKHISDCWAGASLLPGIPQRRKCTGCGRVDMDVKQVYDPYELHTHGVKIVDTLCPACYVVSATRESSHYS
jgi:hypothetical protein